MHVSNGIGNANPTGHHHEPIPTTCVCPHWTKCRQKCKRTSTSIDGPICVLHLNTRVGNKPLHTQNANTTLTMFLPRPAALNNESQIDRNTPGILETDCKRLPLLRRPHGICWAVAVTRDALHNKLENERTVPPSTATTPNPSTNRTFEKQTTVTDSTPLLFLDKSKSKMGNKNPQRPTTHRSKSPQPPNGPHPDSPAPCLLHCQYHFGVAALDDTQKCWK